MLVTPTSRCWARPGMLSLSSDIPWAASKAPLMMSSALREPRCLRSRRLPSVDRDVGNCVPLTNLASHRHDDRTVAGHVAGTRSSMLYCKVFSYKPHDWSSCCGDRLALPHHPHHRRSG